MHDKGLVECLDFFSGDNIARLAEFDEFLGRCFGRDVFGPILDSPWLPIPIILTNVLANGDEFTWAKTNPLMADSKRQTRKVFLRTAGPG